MRDESKRQMTNTAAEMAANPSALLEMLVFGPQGVEASEKRGQAELVASELLPVDLGGEEELFLQLGFKLGPHVPGNALFREATLPSGWAKRKSSHSMWSYIDDEHGRERVAIFYKAAFYDRDANAGVVRRYHAKRDEREPHDPPSLYRVHDRKTGKVIFTPVPEEVTVEHGYSDGGHPACTKWFDSRPVRSVVDEWNEP
jgi:hypothetical protein